MRHFLRDSLQSALRSALLILKFVVPLYILADILLYFDLLRYVGVLFAPLTSLIDLPPEAAIALAAGVLINIYAAIAFAAPLELSPYQWTILGVFLGVCHSIIVESAIMARLGISYLYSVVLRGVGAFLTVLPVLFMPAWFFKGTAGMDEVTDVIAPQYPDVLVMLAHSLGKALVLSLKIIILISLIIVIMDLLKSSTLVRNHLDRFNTSFSIIAGQLLGITYGAGILIREASRGSLSRQDILFIGTFLMICHSLVEDVLLFVLFGANYWIIIGIRLTAALLISFMVMRLFRVVPLRLVMRS